MQRKTDQRGDIRRELLAMGRQDSRYVALYRRVASSFGLGACGMWILYYLLAEKRARTQRDIVEWMSFPKQTVNSAVSRMVRDGLLSLAPAPGSRKEKTVRPTPAGRALAAKTSRRLLEAEIRATAELGVAKMRALNRLRAEYFSRLEAAFGETIFAPAPARGAQKGGRP